MSSYNLQGVCSSQVDFEIENDTLKNVVFHGGCPGNLSAIAKLLEGMKIDDVIQKLEGTTCGNKSTSCSDQLVQALKKAK